MKLTATCSVCGPGVEIMRKGRYGLACREGDREAKRRYKQAHPQRVRSAKRRPASKHRLEKRDGSPDTCAICGPVNPVVVGRGYGCPNRASDLGWKKFAAAPAARCECGVYLTAAGTCLHCDTRENTDLGYALMLSEYGKRSTPDRMGDIFGDEGDQDDQGWFRHEGEVMLSDANESAVPNWKTLGSTSRWDDKPAVRPEYARLYGSGRKVEAS